MGSLDQALRFALIAATAGLLAVSCGGRNDDDAGGGSPSAPSAGGPPVASPTPAPEPSPSPAAPAGQPVWVPPGTFACALGPGDKDSGCDAGTPVFADEVNAAVDRVVTEQRSLFPGGDITARVRDEEAIHVAVARILQAQGLCAGWDLIDLQVRNSNEFSEQYDLFDARGFFITDASRRFRSTCHPARFPLSAHDRIDSLRVAFYGIQCPAGVQKPPNSSGRLPVGCLGHVTATPKDRFFADVDARVHGPYITWELRQRRGFVSVRDDENTAFNKAVRAHSPGFFALCATVQGHTGCLEGEVTEIPQPAE
jgi:hypothetical protein